LHVLFLDYDFVVWDVVQADLEKLSIYCSHFFILQSDRKVTDKVVFGSYHIVCLDLFTFKQILELHKLSHADQSFKDLAKVSGYREWVLRVGKKGKRNAPFFLKFVNTELISDKKQSYEHFVLLCKLYSEVDDINFDWDFDRKNDKVVHSFTLYNTLKERH